MDTQLKLGDISVDVVKKDIKNIHLSVYPPTGRVRIAAPLQMNPEAIRQFAISKIAWIKQHQTKVRNQPRETPRDYINRESHYLWGKRYLLQVVETDAEIGVERRHRTLQLKIRPMTDHKARELILDAWYRSQIKDLAPKIICHWEKLLQVKVKRLFVQRMRTKWGSCNPTKRNIRLNSELAKKPVECLEYIILHEISHLLERNHGKSFIKILDRCMPDWRNRKNILNELPIRQNKPANDGQLFVTDE